MTNYNDFSYKLARKILLFVALRLNIKASKRVHSAAA